MKRLLLPLVLSLSLIPLAGARGAYLPSHQTCFYSSSAGPNCKVRPRAFVIGAKTIIFGLRWQHWGSRRTVGTGRIHSTASSTTAEIRSRVRVRLSSPVACSGRYYYSRTLVRYGNHHFPVSPNLTIPCHY